MKLSEALTLLKDMEPEAPERAPLRSKIVKTLLVAMKQGNYCPDPFLLVALKEYKKKKAMIAKLDEVKKDLEEDLEIEEEYIILLAKDAFEIN